jgi:hypothetical protein
VETTTATGTSKKSAMRSAGCGPGSARRHPGTDRLVLHPQRVREVPARDAPLGAEHCDPVVILLTGDEADITGASRIWRRGPDLYGE